MDEDAIGPVKPGLLLRKRRMTIYAKPKILVVDDKPDNLLTMRSLLEDFDVDLITVDSGAKAVSHALKTDFALILLDVHMPEINGFETAEMMRRNESSSCVPIIFVTAQREDDDVMFQGYEAGAVDFLDKPVKKKHCTARFLFFLIFTITRSRWNGAMPP